MGMYIVSSISWTRRRHRCRLLMRPYWNHKFLQHPFVRNWLPRNIHWLNQIIQWNFRLSCSDFWCVSQSCMHACIVQIISLSCSENLLTLLEGQYHGDFAALLVEAVLKLWLCTFALSEMLKGEHIVISF